jgi:hypothetical protein
MSFTISSRFTTQERGPGTSFTGVEMGYRADVLKILFRVSISELQSVGLCGKKKLFSVYLTLWSGTNFNPIEYRRNLKKK